MSRTPPDPRIPLRFGALVEAGPHDALLMEGDAPAPDGMAVARFRQEAAVFGHMAGCLCCAPRAPAALALNQLFLALARGRLPPFASVLAVVASEQGRLSVLSALESDALAAARFRIDA
jgi:hypothetical protein